MAGLSKIVHGSERAKTILVEDAGPHSPAHTRWSAQQPPRRRLGHDHEPRTPLVSRTRAGGHTATAVHPCIPGSCGQFGSRSIAA
jgi:hypothetical protein